MAERTPRGTGAQRRSPRGAPVHALGRFSTLLVVALLVVGLVGTTTRAAHALDPGSGVVMTTSVAKSLGFATGTGATTIGGLTALPLLAGAALVGTGIWAIGWGATGEADWFWPDGDPDPNPTSPGWEYGNLPDDNLKSFTVTGKTGTVTMHATFHAGAHIWHESYHATEDAAGNRHDIAYGYSSPEMDACDGALECTWTITVPDGYEAIYAHIAIRSCPIDSSETDGCDDASRVRTFGKEVEEPVDRAVRADGVCSDGSTPSSTGATYTTQDEVPAPIPSVVCPPGTTLTGVELTRIAPGNEDIIPDKKIGEYTAPAEFTDPAWEYADCVDGSCKLMLHRILSDGTRVACDDPDVACQGWHELTQPELDYECLWGTHVMPLSDCEEVFLEIDTPGYEGPNEVTEAERLPEDQSGCDTGSWFNPFSKMARAVACALEWAFVPDSQRVKTEVLTPVSDAFWDVPPFSLAPGIATAVQGTFPTAGGAQTCGPNGMIIDLTPPDLVAKGSGPWDNTLPNGLTTRAGIPCEPPPSWDWHIPYGVMTAMVAFGALIGAYNMVAKAVGAPGERSSVQFEETTW